jgi:hypothetical protein
MGFRRSDLQEAFFVPGAQAFRVYGYGTTDPLEEVLGAGYFAASARAAAPGRADLRQHVPERGAEQRGKVG